MFCAESERAGYAIESTDHLVQTLYIRLRDWVGDPLAVPTLKLVAVPRWIHRETQEGVLAVGAAAFERS
jgi:hypothetical protein